MQIYFITKIDLAINAFWLDLYIFSITPLSLQTDIESTYKTISAFKKWPISGFEDVLYKRR